MLLWSEKTATSGDIAELVVEGSTLNGWFSLGVEMLDRGMGSCVVAVFSVGVDSAAHDADDNTRVAGDDREISFARGDVMVSGDNGFGFFVRAGRGALAMPTSVSTSNCHLACSRSCSGNVFSSHVATVR